MVVCCAEKRYARTSSCSVPPSHLFTGILPVPLCNAPFKRSSAFGKVRSWSGLAPSCCCLLPRSLTRYTLILWCSSFTTGDRKQNGRHFMAIAALQASRFLTIRLVNEASHRARIFGGSSRMGKRSDRSAAKSRQEPPDEASKKHSLTTVLSSKTKCVAHSSYSREAPRPPLRCFPHE